MKMIFLRCEISGWFRRLLAPKGRTVFLRSVRRESGAALHRPPSDKNHWCVPERRRWRPEPPQPRDPGAPGHVAHPLQPQRSAAGAGPGRGQAQAAVRPPSASPCVPLYRFRLQGALWKRRRPVAAGYSLQAHQESHPEVRGTGRVRL